MNKYMSALSDIMCFVPYGKLKGQEIIIKELVEKATPKKPIAKTPRSVERYYCGDCGLRLKKTWIACPRCATRIDWSDEE